MHLQRAISNFAILIVGSLTSLVAFLSTRLNEVLFYVLAGGCVVMGLVLASTALGRLGRRVPELLGKSVVPRWNLSPKAPKGKPFVAYRVKNKKQQTLIPTQPERANAA
jgi:hypothetical protein